MVLRRIGNKNKIALKIQQYFPDHVCYCEPFFGAGGMFFNKPLSKYNYLNDLDGDVHNLFMQVMNNKNGLYNYIECVPYHKLTWNWLKYLKPENDLMKAVKFVILSNYGYFGNCKTIKLSFDNSKKILLENINKTFDFLCKSNVMFNCCDFRDFIKQISLRSTRDENDINKTFWYADPPYLETYNNYFDSFTKNDSIDLFDCLKNTGCKYAISEFNNPFIIDQANQRNLNIITIGERQSLKNRNIEILITNYDLQLKLF